MIDRRFLIAALVAVVMIAIVVFAASQMTNTVLAAVRERMKAAKSEGLLPPDFPEDFESGFPGDVGLELPEGIVRRAAIVDWIRSLWFLWAPIVLALRPGVAAMLPRSKG